jgi:putative ubiquitin-RnfH superfamily antitoxin RatB of RatAB toxin-antitoxin module
VLITLARSLGPRQMQEWSVDLPPGATVGEALRASGWLAPDALNAPDFLVGVWGKRCELTAVLREGDRVEIYRGLRVDPKLARRERFKGQGVRRAGLFAKRRPGAKPGY